MRSPASALRAGLLLTVALIRPAAAAVTHYQVAGDEPGAWPRIFSSIGLVPGPRGVTAVTGSATTTGPLATWRKRIEEEGAILVTSGVSPLTELLGIAAVPGRKPVPVRSVVDIHNPKLPIVWERRVEVPRVSLPDGAVVFTRERWDNAPLAVGIRLGAGALLWTAVTPGEKGYERYPYLLQALASMGASPALQSRELWAFFDSSYRSRVDLDYFAARWRKAGIAGLHVAAWHYFEPDEQRDGYLRRLIEACHRNAILVFPWIELPHVSEAFWAAHPEWREQTAIGQDAHLDWRRLMNLQNRDCFRAVAAGIHALMDRFDWDGINLAELYFESLEGAANAARFTPMNADVRREFAQSHGFDPKELFSPGSDPGRLRKFLDWRADLARRMQEEWIAEMEKVRARKPHLGLVLTHVDDRYDNRMRDLIGADAARLLPLLASHDFTFLIEDPATVWHLGPERYPEIARRYAPLTARPEKLAIDINVVERYQDVYPTKQQTGVELFQLVNLAARAFQRVALYFENSLLAVDQPLLPAAAAVPDRVERAGDRLVVESKRAIGVPAPYPVTRNGNLWPFWDGAMAWLPPGAHVIAPASASPAIRLLDFSGQIQTIDPLPGGFEFSYSSDARGWARFDKVPAAVDVDGAVVPPAAILPLPRGQHLVSVRAARQTAAKR
jgi:hypothetical protein